MGFLDSIGSFFSGGADKAAMEAARQQAAGYDAAGKAITTGETTALGYLSPYRESGDLATREQSRLLGLFGADEAAAARARFQTSPGYDFQVDEGQRVLERGVAARGGLYSGSAGKALVKFGQGVANQDFGNHFSRLAGLGSTGLSAAGSSASTVSNAAGARADALLGRSNALASGTINANAARNQGWSNLFQLGSKAVGMAMGIPPIGGGGDKGLGSWAPTVSFA